MDLRSALGSGATLILVVFVVAMILGQLLGQPILLGFVLTGSMDAEPANMAPGDGFVAIPPVFVDDIETGDVVTFNARELQGGGLTTHRVVGQTEEGYITRGDANPFTDQDGPEPPVREAQIVAVILILILAPATASMVIPSQTNDITIVSSQSPSESPTVIEQGGSVTYDYNFTNEGFLPRVGVIEPKSTGVEVAQPVLVASRGESVGTPVTIYAPVETGAYIRSVSQRQYLGILPLPILLTLHSLHPFVAIAAIDAVIGTLVTVVFVLAVGLEPFRFRSRDRDISILDRLQRAIRKWR